MFIMFMFLFAIAEGTASSSADGQPLLS